MKNFASRLNDQEEFCKQLEKLRLQMILRYVTKGILFLNHSIIFRRYVAFVSHAAITYSLIMIPDDVL